MPMRRVMRTGLKIRQRTGDLFQLALHRLARVYSTDFMATTAPTRAAAKEEIVRKLSIIGVFVIAVSLYQGSLHAAEKLGKIFIKAASSEVNGQQFSDVVLEDSVKDLKKRLEKGQGPFVLASNESEAEFLLVVVERKVELSGFGGKARISTRRLVSRKVARGSQGLS